jgi:hypothetical protein
MNYSRDVTLFISSIDDNRTLKGVLKKIKLGQLIVNSIALIPRHAVEVLRCSKALRSRSLARWHRRLAKVKP